MTLSPGILVTLWPQMRNDETDRNGFRALPKAIMYVNDSHSFDILP